MVSGLLMKEISLEKVMESEASQVNSNLYESKFAPAFNDIEAIKYQRDESIILVIYKIILYFSSLPATVVPSQTRRIALQALGNIFSSHPRLLLRDDARELCDGVFASSINLDSSREDQAIIVDTKIGLLNVFLKFLAGEQARMREEERKALIGEKKSRKSKKDHLDIKVLIGNADIMTDAG